MFKILEKWLVKRTFNKDISSIWCKLIPPEYLYKKISYRIASIDNLTFRIDISKVVDHAIFWGFRDKTVSFFLSHLKNDYTVIDIGANIGIISVQSAIRSKKVISIEPDKMSFDNLVANLKRNKITNVITLNLGLGCKEEIKRLYKVIENNPGMNRIMDDDLSLPYSNVQIRTLDNIVKELNLTQIDVIKIDTEGYEMNILKGAENCIKNFKPYIMLEIDNNLLMAQSSSARELLDFINSKGYQIYDIANEKIIRNSEKEIPCHIDVWCFFRVCY